MTVRERVERIEKECSEVWASYGVTLNDRAFLASLKVRTTLVALSEKQERWLRDIEAKVFGEEDDDDEEG